MGSDCEADRIEGLNELFQVENGVELSPGVVPKGEFWDDENNHYVEDVSAWWNSTMARDGVERDVLFFDDQAPEISVSFGLVPITGEELENETGPLGIAYLDYTVDGAIFNCEIVISSDIQDSESTVEEVLRHESGHCLGLADDPDSIDLNSVMADPYLEGGELYQGDWEVLVNYMDE
jgi:hypothetical protein